MYLGHIQAMKVVRFRFLEKVWLIYIVGEKRAELFFRQT